MFGNNLLDPDALAIDFGGQKVHFCQDSGGKLKYHGEQNDRAAVMALDPADGNTMRHLANEAAEAADEAVVALNKGKREYEHRLHATLVSAIYDPKSFQLWVRSRGDSPLYLILSGEDQNGDPLRHAIPLSTMDKGSVSHSVTNYLGDTSRYRPSLRSARYAIPAAADSEAVTPDLLPEIPASNIVDEEDGTRWKIECAITPDRSILGADHVLGDEPAFGGGQDPVDLRRLIGQATKNLGMRPETVRADLVIGSDCLTEDPGLCAALADRLDTHHGAGEENLAKALVKEQKETIGEMADNQTVMVLPDIREGKGRPLALCVCDGVGSGSFPAAQAAVEAFEKTCRARAVPPETQLLSTQAVRERKLSDRGHTP